MAELQCAGLYRAGYHPGCCLWGVGSGYTTTTTTTTTIITKHKLYRGTQRGRKRREEGGRFHLEQYNTGKEKRGEDGGRQWGKVQNGSNRFAPLLLRFFHFTCFFHPLWHIFFSVLCIFIHYFINIRVAAAFISFHQLSVGESVRPWWINLTNSAPV